jgi:hypothetical protein
LSTYRAGGYWFRSLIRSQICEHSVLSLDAPLRCPADMQVTSFADEKPLSQTQRKSIPYSCNQVRCLVGWTGLATIESYNTGDWLHQQLDVLSREDPPLGVLIDSLTNAATLQFAMLPKRSLDKRCEFSLAGWFAVDASLYACFVSTISNFEMYPWQLSASYAPIFRHSTATEKIKSKHCYSLSISGEETTAKELGTRFVIGAHSSSAMRHPVTDQEQIHATSVLSSRTQSRLLLPKC